MQGLGLSDFIYVDSVLMSVCACMYKLLMLFLVDVLVEMLVSGLYARSLNSLPPPHSPTHLQEDPFEFLEILCLKCF